MLTGVVIYSAPFLLCTADNPKMVVFRGGQDLPHWLPKVIFSHLGQLVWDTTFNRTENNISLQPADLAGFFLSHIPYLTSYRVI
jgi:hypothetical protein